MARPRTIDRNRVLDAAEAVVQKNGPTGLTLDAVAREAAVTKGGIQSVFGTKEGLLHAMLERWEQGVEDAIRHHTDPDEGGAARIRAHIRATINTSESEKARTAALLSALVHSKDQQAETRRWYASVIGNGEVGSDLARNTRLAFIAAEGLFLLKHFDLIDMPDQTWDEIGNDILTLLSKAT